MIYFSMGSEEKALSTEEIKNGLYEALDKLGKRNTVLAVPPDITRFHSRAGELTRYIRDYYGDGLKDVLPALGTHFAMTENEIDKMYEGVPKNLFRVHNWKQDLVTLGTVPGNFVKEVSGGLVDYNWPAQVNKLLVKGGHDLILSIGQVVPHEVVGMANYNKNIFIGTGGTEGINKSHFLGAVYGMERMMGRVDTPVRRVLNYASDNFSLPAQVVYVLTVIGKDADGSNVMKGLFIGDDEVCFQQAAELSVKVNLQLLEEPLQKVVVYLDPTEFKSTWLGNKAIYRTRMAIADEGELIILAPGLKNFGEDHQIDKLIRKYGYLSTPEILDLVRDNVELQNNLSAAAHLIHGSSEKRFSITYCPRKISREEIEGVKFQYADLDQMLKKYNPEQLKDGWNTTSSGEEIFYISNPALGLWALEKDFRG